MLITTGANEEQPCHRFWYHLLGVQEGMLIFLVIKVSFRVTCEEYLKIMTILLKSINR